LERRSHGYRSYYQALPVSPDGMPNARVVYGR
jgi:hypothetical protein